MSVRAAKRASGLQGRVLNIFTRDIFVVDEVLVRVFR